ncbi:MAG: response regulator [Verrucomicrobia bacterium]|nr:response regulator [Verrucomicrobiota bacterium]
MRSPSPSDTTSKSSDLPAKRTLLIVDDEEGPRQSLRVVFKDDYHLLIANDGNTAMDMVKQNKVDAVVSDIRMFGMSGVELLGHLKAIDQHIEVILLTAYETADTLRQALRLGACDYLNKPFDIADIRTAVANAMERRSLSEQISRNSRQLQELQAELQNQKMMEEITRSRGEIYASIIHDINGPLTVISGFIQLMNQRIGTATRLEGEDLDNIKDRQKTITRQVTNCINISRRYLSFLRQQADGNATVAVNQILADLVELIGAHPSVQDNQFQIHPLPQDVIVRINGTDLIQILLNLMVNAFQSTPKNHRVDLRSLVLSEPLELSGFLDGPHDRLTNRETFKNVAPLLSLSVSDNGPGIPPEIVPKLFNAYFTTKALSQGTGLGLNIVQRLVKEAHGAIHVHTKVGEGTTFTLYLPVVQDSELPPAGL